MKLAILDYVVLVVADLDRSLAFYTGTLGLPLQYRAEKYAQIWTPDGSPLAVHTRRQTDLLRSVLPDLKIEYAMRYGEPAIAPGLATLQDPMADAYFADYRLQDGLKRRNESMYGHGKEPVGLAHVQEVAARLRALLRAHLPPRTGWPTPTACPSWPSRATSWTC